MKNYPYYLYTVLGFILIYTCITLLTAASLSRANLESTLSRDLEAAQQEANILKVMSEGALGDLEKEKLKNQIQTSIALSDSQVIFNSVLDWSGKYVCYPNKKEIGKSPSENSALQLEAQEEINGKLLRKFVQESTTSKVSSAIILLTPVQNSDWIIASHINKARVLEDASRFKNLIYRTSAIIGLITLLIMIGALSVVSRHYQKLLALKSSQWEDGVLNLSKLNASLENYQKSLIAAPTEKTELKEENPEITKEETIPAEKNTKQRIITYVRNEILSIATEEISHIYVENTITYVVRKDGKRSTTSESLDLIYSYLDERYFFRVNRQIIVAISAINTITKFGNSKLKIQVNPASEIDIIIGKNKAAAFKQWLDL